MWYTCSMVSNCVDNENAPIQWPPLSDKGYVRGEMWGGDIGQSAGGETGVKLADLPPSSCRGRGREVETRGQIG